MLVPFAPYIRKIKPTAFPELPFDVTGLESHGAVIPDDIKTATGYREFLGLLTDYGRAGLKELRAVNPLTRGKADDEIEEEMDEPFPAPRAARPMMRSRKKWTSHFRPLAPTLICPNQLCHSRFSYSCSDGFVPINSYLHNCASSQSDEARGHWTQQDCSVQQLISFLLFPYQFKSLK